MKLVAIEDIRVGQIYELDKKKYGGGFTIVNEIDKSFFGVLGFLVNWNNGSNVNSNSSTTEFLDFDISKNKDYKLIGSLNITHKIENNKLVEIPREEFEVDDVFVYTECDGLQSYYSLHQITKDGEFLLISDNDDKVLSGVCADNLLDNGLLKCGILGVSYEWVNDKLIKE